MLSFPNEISFNVTHTHWPIISSLQSFPSISFSKTSVSVIVLHQKSCQFGRLFAEFLLIWNSSSIPFRCFQQVYLGSSLRKCFVLQFVDFILPINQSSILFKTCLWEYSMAFYLLNLNEHLVFLCLDVTPSAQHFIKSDVSLDDDFVKHSSSNLKVLFIPFLQHFLLYQICLMFVY